MGSRGQALVEFTVVFMIFLTVFFSIIEFSRALNVLVTLNTVAASAARVGAAEDPLLSVDDSAVETAAVDMFSNFAYLDASRLTVETDVNWQSSAGYYNTRVRLTYQMDPLLIPNFGAGGIPISVQSVKTNEIQLKR